MPNALPGCIGLFLAHGSLFTFARIRRLRRSNSRSLLNIDQRVRVETRGNDVCPFVQDFMQRFIPIDIQVSDCTAPGTRMYLLAYTAHLVDLDQGPE